MSAKSDRDEDEQRKEQQKLRNEKAALAREEFQWRQQQMLEGEEWNEVFKSHECRKDKDKVSDFWEELKLRLLKKSGSLNDVIDSLLDGCGSITNLKFGDILRITNFPLNQTVQRFLFDLAADGARHIPPENFKALLMARTIRKLKFISQNYNKKQANIQKHFNNFLRSIMEVDEKAKLKMVDKLQRKMTVSHIRNMWQVFLTHTNKSRSEDITLTRSSFAAILRDNLGKYWQAYEEEILVNILVRAASLQEGGKSINMPGFITALVLLSAEEDRRAKLGLIFDLFDTDYDGCLHFWQISDLCHCISRLLPLVDPMACGPVDFQKMLCVQDGLRNYECTRWFLHRTGRVEGHDVVSLPELWQAWEMQPELLVRVLPGRALMHWAVSNPESSGRRATVPAVPQVQAPVKRTLRKAHTTAFEQQLEGRQTIRKAVTGLDISTQRVSKLNLTESMKLKLSVQEKFGQRLKGFGDQRLGEMLSSISTSKKVLGSELLGKRSTVSTWDDLHEDFLMSSSGSAFRPVQESPSQKERRRSLSRSASAPLLAIPQTPTLRPDPSFPGPLPRSRGSISAPGTAGTAGTAGTLMSMGSSGGFEGGQSLRLRGAGDTDSSWTGTWTEPPMFRTRKWGLDAAERMKLVSSAQMWRQGSNPKDNLLDPAIHGQVFRCQICQQLHTVCPGHGVI